MVQHSYVGALLLLSLCLPSGSWAATEGQVEQLTRELQADVMALQQARDQLAEVFPAKDPEDFRTGVMRLNLSGALDGKDLLVELLRRDGAFVDGRAVASTWGPIFYRVGVDELQWQGTTLSGRLTVDVIPWANLERHHPDQGRVRPSIFAVTASVEAKGTAKLVNPAVGIGRTGESGVSLRWLPRLEPQLSRAKQPDIAEPFIKADWWYQRGRQIWRELRALDLMQRHGFPYEVALAQIPRLRLQWENPAAAAEETIEENDKKDKKEAIADGLDDDLEFDLDSELDDLLVDPAKLVPVLMAMRAHLARHVAASRGLGQPDPSVAQGSLDSGDADFHPASCSVPLKPDGNEKGILVLPKDLGKAGPQAWVHPGQWRSLGPVPTTMWGGHSPILPDCLPALEAKLVVDVAGTGGAFTTPYAGGPQREWETMPVRPLNGRFWPPRACQHTYVMPGREWTGYFHHVALRSPKDIELWASVVATYAAHIWVNDRLVWQSGRLGADPQSVPHQWLLKLPLRKGVNQIVMRVDQAELPCYAALHLCVAGGPRPAAEAKAAIAKRMERYATAGAAGATPGIQQFRRDHTGVVDEAQPVLAWNIVQGINVKWAKSYGPSAGTPLTFVDDLVLTTEEPNLLIALDKQTGELRWRRRLDRMELHDAAIWAQAAPLWQQVDALVWGAEGAMAKRKELFAQLEALYPERWRPELDPDPNPGFAGRFMSSLITDGKRIWGMCAGKLLACFSKDGTRQWFVHTGATGGGMGHQATSPIYHDGKIIAQISVYGQQELEQPIWDEYGGWPWERQPQRRHVMRAWDADTGDVLWTTRRYRMPNFGNRYDADGITTPHPLRLVNEHQQLDVLLSGGGQVFRASDGKLLLPHIGHETRSAPFVPLGQGKVAVFSTTDYHKSGGYVAGVELILHDEDQISAKTLWVSRWHIAAGYGGYVHYQGLLHGLHSKMRGVVWTLDAVTGEICSGVRDVSRHMPGNVYMSPAIVGGYLFHVCDGRNSFNKAQLFRHQGHTKGTPLPYQSGSMTSLLPGRHPLILARNVGLPHDGAIFSPEPDGERLYLRFRRTVVCLSRTEEGERYEAEEIARTLLSQLPSPGMTSETIVEAPRVRDPSPGVEEEHFFRNGEVVRRLWAVGPITSDEADAAFGKLKLDQGAPWYMHEQMQGKTALSGWPLYPRTKVASDGYVEDIGVRDFRYGLLYDISAVNKDQAGTTSYWVGNIGTHRQRVLRLDQALAGIRCWVNGQELLHGQCVRVPRGSHLVVFRADCNGSVMRMAPRFWDATDPAAERAMQQERLERARPFLERASTLSEDAELKAAVEAVLAQ